jgi:CheY-like chemotaxis protein
MPLQQLLAQHTGSASLQGRRILVVEDDFVLAQDLREELEGQGAEVIGPAATVTAALDLLKAGPAPCAAILDVNVGGESVYPVAAALQAQETPFLFATGCELGLLPEVYADVPCAEKPVAVGPALVG